MSEIPITHKYKEPPHQHSFERNPDGDIYGEPPHQHSFERNPAGDIYGERDDSGNVIETGLKGKVLMWKAYKCKCGYVPTQKFVGGETK